MIRDLHPVIRWTVAGLASGIICIAAFWFFGDLLPTWIFGPDSPTSPTSGQVFSISLTFASAYSLLAFFLLMVFFYHRLSGRSGS